MPGIAILSNEPVPLVFILSVTVILSTKASLNLVLFVPKSTSLSVCAVNTPLESLTH